MQSKGMETSQKLTKKDMLHKIKQQNFKKEYRVDLLFKSHRIGNYITAASLLL